MTLYDLTSQANFATLSAQVADLRTKLAALTTSVTALTTRLTAAEEDIMVLTAGLLRRIVPTPPLGARCLATDYTAPTVPSPLRTFYVDSATGNDITGTGAIGAPWQTLAKINSTAIAGDQFNVRGTFAGTAEMIRPNVSGTATNKIHIRNWPGFQPLVTGYHTGNDVNIWLTGRTHVVVEGLKFTNGTCGNPCLLGDGTAGTSNIWIRNCVFDGQNVSVIKLNRATDCRVEDCTISNVGPTSNNDHDGIFLQNGSDRAVIVRNTITNCNHAGMSIGSYQSSSELDSDAVVVAQNSIRNPWAGCLNVNGKTTNVLVECNDLADAFTNSPITVSVGTKDNCLFQGRNGTFRYNRIWNAYRRGVSMETYAFAGYTQLCIGNKLYHNTIFDCGGAGMAMGCNTDAIAGMLNNQIDNNLAYNVGQNWNAVEGTPGVQPNGVGFYIILNTNPWPKPGGVQDLNGNIWRNNRFSRSGGFTAWFQILGAQRDSYTPAQWNALGTNVLNTDAGDPTFVSMAEPNPDLHLQSTSNAIDIGYLEPNVAFSGVAPDLGAFEGGVVVAPPFIPDFYVSPTGSSANNGSINSPWSLSYAFGGAGGALTPGKKVALRGGTYSGEYFCNVSGTQANPIVFRQYPGERAILDGNILTVGTHDLWFWGFEITQSNPVATQRMGINNRGPRCRFINMVIHDCGLNGVGDWVESPNSEVYGCLLYNNGTNHNLDHGYYGECQTPGTKLVRDNICFTNWAYGFQVYGSSGQFIDNFTFRGNVGWNNAVIDAGTSRAEFIMGGSGIVARGAVFDQNMTYRQDAGQTADIGWFFGGVNVDVAVTNNYFVGELDIYDWQTATVTGNTLYNTGQMVVNRGTLTGHTWSGNNFYRAAGATAWQYGGTNTTFAGWKTLTGFTNPGTLVGTTPTTNQIFYRPNLYEPGRGHIIIYNWQGLANVAVDLSQILSVGQAFTIVNAQNFFGASVLSGTYTGGTVNLPMAGITPPAPVGRSFTQAPTTGPTFQVFVVRLQGA